MRHANFELVSERKDAYAAWLSSNTKLGRRTIGDMVSRARRVSKLVDIALSVDDTEFLYRLSRAPGFNEYSPAVQSQLKRAADLFRRFLQSDGKNASKPGPTFIDLFAGAGGLSLGFKNAGWTSLLAVDNWQDAIKTYRRNFPDDNVFDGDIEELTRTSLEEFTQGKVDWVIGGPPCQGFSTVGKRKKSDPRNQLVREFARITDLLRPAGVMIENVIGLRDMKFIEFVCTLFYKIGYRLTPFVLAAADYGVPQLRRRIFFVGKTDDSHFVPPKPSHTRDDYVCVEDAIGDLPALAPGEGKSRYDRDPVTNYQRRMRGNSMVLQGHIASRHPEYLVRAISHIPDGGNRRHIPTELQPKSGYHNSYSRLHSKSPAVAVTQNMGKPSATRCIHPFQNRGLTAREGARLQGFPDEFHFEAGPTSQRLQIANAVSPLLGETIARALITQDSWR